MTCALSRARCAGWGPCGDSSSSPSSAGPVPVGAGGCRRRWPWGLSPPMAVSVPLNESPVPVWGVRAGVGVSRTYVFCGAVSGPVCVGVR